MSMPRTAFTQEPVTTPRPSAVATMQRKSLVDPQEVRRALAVMREPGQVFEIRALKASIEANGRYLQTLAGYFDSTDDAIRAIQTLRQAEGIYITLQPVNPKLINRVYKRLKPQEKDFSTPDKEITSYCWLPIDSDVTRPAHISSTDAEHELALAHSTHICDTLRAEGWPEPIKADSANGAHLNYKIDLPIDDKNLVQRVLEGLAARFDTEMVHVDTSVYNPARIWKLYGTLACKGDDTPECPHRRAHIVDLPETIETVSRDLLEAIATPIQPITHTAPTTNTNKPATPNQWDMEKFIAKHHIDTESKEPYQGGYKWILKQCPFCESTDRKAILTQSAEGKLGFKCVRECCKAYHWQELRAHYEPTTKEETALTRLMKIAEQARYIMTPGGALYARVPVNGHHEVVSINESGSGFRRWLVFEYKQAYGTAPNSDAISLTMSGVMADAEYTGEKAKVYTRIAYHDGCVYLDLCNEQWQCVKISADGYKVVKEPPVYFRRVNGMLPLPMPTKGGSLSDDLREIIHAESEIDYRFIEAWAIGALHPKGPYPVLNLNGERGSAKTYTTKVLRNLLDPNEAPTRNAPKDDQAAAIMAQNNMIVALDNLSSLPMWLSDKLCRIATGSGDSARTLYTNGEETIFSSCRPIIMNGIEDGLISQGDLLNRTMMVTLCPPSTYKPEEEMDALFHERHPRILGALLEAAAYALKHRASTRLEKPPRMADFALWVTTCEPLLKWESGSFIQAYTSNQDNASSIILESSPVALAITQLMNKRKENLNTAPWESTTQELLNALSDYEVFSNAKHRPKNARVLSGSLKRIAPSLRVQGIDLQQPPRDKRGSKVIISIASNIAGVAKDGAGVAKDVAKDDLLHPNEPTLQATLPVSDVASVVDVAKCSTLSAILESEKNKEKEEIADKEVKFATPHTLATSGTQNITAKSDGAIAEATQFIADFCSQHDCSLRLRDDGKIGISVPESMSDAEFDSLAALVDAQESVLKAALSA